MTITTHRLDWIAGASTQTLPAPLPLARVTGS